MIYRMDVKGANGKTNLRALLIPLKEPNPNFPTLTDPSHNLIEFYDLRYIGPRFSPDGQFISRYHLNSLKECSAGLCLEGGIPDWAIKGKALSQILDWASYLIYQGD